VNRTWIRGVTAGVGASVVLALVTIVGPAIARGAENTVDYNRPLVAEENAALHVALPHVGNFLRPVHRLRPPAHRASRSSYRASLTGDPRTIAHALTLRAGWSDGQWRCLDTLWTRESGWRTFASNARSGAYGIPQALPGGKMATFGSDWRTNPITQIRWGLWYIRATYGSPCSALAHSNGYGYY
jgi:hypothetical protein